MSDGTRLDRLRTLLAERRLDAVLVSLPANRFYFTGFADDDDGPDESSGVLLVDHSAATLYTSPNNVGWAESTSREGVGVAAWERPWERFVGAAIAERGWSWLGFEDAALSVASHRELVAAAGSALAWEPLGDAANAPRAAKEPAELAIMERAIRLTDEAFAAATAKLEVGWSERRLARTIDDALRAVGAAGPAFPTIVAAGPHAARPHHQPGERPIGHGEPVIIDMGARLDGYAADLTRTIWLGPATPRLWEVYTVVMRAQRAALAAIAPGAVGKEVDAVARGVIDAAGYGDRFLHGVGHGLGVRVHEVPSLGKVSTDVLAIGQVVTVEPGIYLDGWGGVRIEDVVVVAAGGARVLTGAPKREPSAAETETAG